jgi:DNA-binding MarR family transcriptional regulator
MQILTDARDMGTDAMRETQVDPATVDAVLTASRSMVAVATRSLGAAAEETTIAQYRALVVLASRGPRPIAGLAEALDVAPSTAGRMCDRLVRKGLVRRHRAHDDRRVVLVSITPAGRQVVDEATGRRRALITSILAKLPPAEQQAVARALRVFADAAGEVPDDQWPTAGPGPDEDAPVSRPPVRRRHPRPVRDGLEEQR